LSAIEARDLWGNAKKDVREKFLRFSLGFTGFKLAEYEFEYEFVKTDLDIRKHAIGCLFAFNIGDSKTRKLY